MPKKRRKLNKEMEPTWRLLAQDRADFRLINDIREDIQGEYLEAFGQVFSGGEPVAKYTTDDFCEETEGLLALYRGLIDQFEADYGSDEPASGLNRLFF